MKTFAAILAFALCNCGILVSGLSAQPRSILTDVINTMVNNARPKLKDIQFPIIGLQERGNITDATLQNLDTFLVTQTQIGNILALEVKLLAIQVDVLKLIGSFNFVNLDLPVVGTVSGSGSINADLNNVGISASLTFQMYGLSLRVKDISNVAVTVASANAALTGIDPSLAESVNGGLTQIVPVSIPKLIEDNKASIIAWMNENLL